jgi:hypothetical protein
MLPNGHAAVLDMALRSLGEPLPERYRDAMLLGAHRGNVWHVPLLNRVVEHLSLSHFYRPGLEWGFLPFLPGPLREANRWYARALQEQRAGRTAAAFVWLGRVIHLVVDMSCPTHAHSIAHTTDPYEWYVEGNRQDLEELPVPNVGDRTRPSQIVREMAERCRRFRPDRTHNVPGWFLQRMGAIRPVLAKQTAEQATVLVPLCAGYTVALLRLFLRESKLATAVGAGA